MARMQIEIMIATMLEVSKQPTELVSRELLRGFIQFQSQLSGTHQASVVWYNRCAAYVTCGRETGLVPWIDSARPLDVVDDFDEPNDYDNRLRSPTNQHTTSKAKASSELGRTYD